MVQHINRIRAVQVHLLRPASPPNILDNVIRVCGADDWDLGREPLLERLRGEVAVRCEPPCHRRADVYLLLWVRGVRCGREDDVAFVDGDVLLGGGGYADLQTVSIHTFCIQPRRRQHNAVAYACGLERTLPVLPSPSYTTPFSTNHSQYENAPFRMK